MRAFLLATLLCGVGGAAMAAPCAPQSLVHIVVRNVTPGIDPDSFGAKPISLYRLGDAKSRSEEADDPAKHLHQLIVADEPNVWMANLDDGTGLHVIDPGPTFYTIMPVFSVPGVSPRIIQLEFGCEAEFIKDNGLSPVRAEQVQGESYDVYRLNADGDAVELLEKHGKNVPTFARYFRGGEPLIVLHYDLYELGLQDDPSLFIPPTDVKYEEQTTK
jgi:hypothetical protein